MGSGYGEWEAETLADGLGDFNYTFTDDEEFVEKLNHLGKLYHVPDGDMLDEIFAFAENNKISSRCLSLQALENFEAILQKKMKKKIELPKASSAKKTARKILGEFPSLGAHYKSIPVLDDDTEDVSFLDSSQLMENVEGGTLSGHYRNFTPIKNSPASASYANRKDSGRVLQQFSGPLFGTGSEQKCAAAVTVISAQASAQYSCGRAAAVIEGLTSHLLDMRSAFHELHPDIESFTQLGEASSKPMHAVGFVTNDSSEDLPLGEATASLVFSEGEVTNTAHLDFTELPTVTIFPGQVVAFTGTKEADGPLRVTKQLEPALLPLADFEPKGPTIENLRIIMASGPFTAPSTASYEPLADLLEAVKKEPPHVLILMGPFVDRRNTYMTRSDAEFIRDDVLNALLRNIATTLEDTPTTVLIQMNAKDAGVIPVFPTPAFEVDEKKTSERLQFIPDPCVLNVAGVEVAVTSSGIIQALSRQEYHRSEESENEDRMARLVSHLFRQRSLYPLQPPALGTAMEDALMMCRLQRRPHLLVAPTLLATFAKAVDGVLCANPGPLSRGASAGAYLKVELTLGVAAPSLVPTPAISLVDFAKMEIIKI